jgi:DNA-binding MarR family transcriptional regulator
LPRAARRKSKAAGMNKRAGTGKERSSIDSETLVALFRRAVHSMTRFHHHHGHSRHAQARVLSVLKEKNQVGRRELLEMLKVRSASLSETLGKLERNGFIRRSRDERDRRNFIITVTDRGDAAATGYQQGRRESADTLFALLTVQQRRQLRAILNKIINASAQGPSVDRVCRDGHDHAHSHEHEHEHEHEHSHEHDHPHNSEPRLKPLT